MDKRPVYDCDTFSYWCSEDDYNSRDKTYGRFIENDRAYKIVEKNTPRPWLNYLCNDKIATAVSNTGKGFMWYKSSLLRITKYDHPIDYLPREFQDGREVIIEDEDSGEKWNVFRDAKDVHCVHRPGYTAINVKIDDIKVTMIIFVPLKDACECWLVSLYSNHERRRKLRVRFQQTWAIARFGIHTAEEGIPYLSTPGEKLYIENRSKGIYAHTDNPDLPVNLWTCFQSPQALYTKTNLDIVQKDDGRVFEFPVCNITCSVELKAGVEEKLQIVSGVEEDVDLFHSMVDKYIRPEVFYSELENVKKHWEELIESIYCEIPDRNMQKFLNIWLKNQIYLTYRFVRSGYIGYRDSLQDTWGYELIEPGLTRNNILKILSHMKKDGSCPRNFSPFGMQDNQDLRNFMDSATWIGMCITDYIKETGDKHILQEKIRYLDDIHLDTVENHIWKAFDLLYSNRGMKGLCLIGDGDWNDGIEGISKHGPAVSVWLTIALFHGQNLLADLYKYLGDFKKEKILRDRSLVLKKAINDAAWDGEWYVYAFSGTGNAIGSKENKEGIIHLNSNTWAVFTGISDSEKTKKVMDSIKKHLDTPVGPALLYPPYVKEGEEVGRIARLEPGTFENGSVYQHAVSFKIFADIASGNYEQAYKTFVNVLPTNPDNFDNRRSSEPYCMGNYYCGPTHKRFGQNFFSWFTGTPAWLLRAGFDEILGVKADYEGLKIDPKVPSEWNTYKVKRVFRNTLYNISFERVEKQDDKGIWVDDKQIHGKLIIHSDKKAVCVRVFY